SRLHHEQRAHRSLEHGARGNGLADRPAILFGRGLLPVMPLRLPILDRYMLTELAGPFGFGLGAFTLIFAATEILQSGKLVSNDHAPLWAALLVFAWSLPGYVVLVIPMA